MFKCCSHIVILIMFFSAFINQPILRCNARRRLRYTHTTNKVGTPLTPNKISWNSDFVLIINIYGGEESSLARQK